MRTKGSPERDGAAEPITWGIARRLSRQILVMESLVGDAGNSLLFHAIREQTRSALTDIRSLILDGSIFPRCDLRLSGGAPGVPPSGKRLRIGVLPVAADPLHWNHLLAGLKAMAHFELDKVVYVISGSDPRKPDLLRANVRYHVGRRTLRLLSPLFACSPLGRDEARDGEANIFRILQLNPMQEIDAYYIAGMDHYHRYAAATGTPDTIAKLENGIRQKAFGYDGAMHSISALFMERGGQPPGFVESFLDIGIIPGTPFETSSTSIRETLAGAASPENLAALPYSAFAEIQSHGLYPRSGGALTALPPR
jgi:hypothetical protein